MDKCGETVFLQNFDQYPGQPANYTKDMALVDFPRLEPRKAGNGERVKPGLISATGWGRAHVGDSVLRTTHPAGAHTLCARRAACSACLPCQPVGTSVCFLHGCKRACICTPSPL